MCHFTLLPLKNESIAALEMISEKPVIDDNKEQAMKTNCQSKREISAAETVTS